LRNEPAVDPDAAARAEAVLFDLLFVGCSGSKNWVIVLRPLS
jgi:hypothetical protein